MRGRSAESARAEAALVACLDENPCKRATSAFARRATSGSLGRGRLYCGDSRVEPASCGDFRPIRVRDLRGMRRSRRSTAPASATRDADLQAFYGSDGTRTRDLRRDRPVRGSRRWTTIPAEPLDSCGFSALSRVDSARLSEALFRRLLPVCCPGSPPSAGGAASSMTRTVRAGGGRRRLSRRGTAGSARRRPVCARSAWSPSRRIAGR
jgi:hypothetical protein